MNALCIRSRSARIVVGGLALAVAAAAATAGVQLIVPTKVTNGASIQGDDNPAWAPGGGRVAWERRSVNPAYPAIFYKDLPAGAETQLTGAGESYPDYQQPCYSPDGSQVAYAKKDGTWYHIYVRPAGGGAETAVTSGTAGPNSDGLGDWMPAWSPDGQWIAFASSRGDLSSGMYDIWVIRADGSGVPRQVSHQGVDSGWPSWSPDGTRIVFSMNDEVWQVTKSGGAWGGQTVLWSGGNHPAVSPDGVHIAYENAADIQVRAWGPPLGAPIVITQGADDDRAPAWSPDGKSLAFSSNHDGNRAIWVASGLDQVPTVPVTLGRIKAAYR